MSLFKAINSIFQILVPDTNSQGFRRYFLNTSWLFAEQVLRIIAGLIVGIYVARYLGPQQFGVYSYVIAFVAIFATVARLGIDSVLVRYLVNNPTAGDLYLGTAFWLKLVGSFLTLGLIAVTVKFSSTEADNKIYILIIASGLILQSFDVVDCYFQSKVLSKYVSICRLAQLGLSSTLKIYLMFIEADLFWFIIVLLIDQLSLAAFLSFSYWRQNTSCYLTVFDKGIAWTVLKSSWPIIVSSVAVSLYMRIDQIMIMEMIGNKQVGVYSAAVRLSEAWYFVPLVIAKSLFPAILNAKKISEKLYSDRLDLFFRTMIYLAVLVAIFVTFFSERIIIGIYGADYREAASVLAIHIWTGIFVSLGVVNGYWFIAENLQKFSMFNTLLGLVVNIILNYFLMPVYGASGAAAATLVSYGFSAYFLLMIFSETRVQFFKITFSIFPKISS
ncbi:flippase [Roseovarius sp. 10]|uniref:flippase n=1 Tax=Roseovarius sp. 10 TaxID=3080563 RepID=UPI002955460B|nr:flippase [Roseovarius sp. 10]MDV7199722.1 flippase [Roseovarius sp. 10]